MTQLPLYQCHKQVRAARIVGIDRHRIGNVLCLNNGHKVDVDLVWLVRNPKTEVGGYYVQYEDGYTSYSPAAAFESGYTLVIEEDE